MTDDIEPIDPARPDPAYVDDSPDEPPAPDAPQSPELSPKDDEVPE